VRLEEWERDNSKIEEYYHAGQYCAWAVKDGKVVTATGDTKAEAKDNLCSQLGVEP
jgi:hypothetical protein